MQRNKTEYEFRSNAEDRLMCWIMGRQETLEKWSFENVLTALHF